MLKKICIWTLFVVTGVVGLCLFITGWFYITCPVYIFEEQKPFAGSMFYNPYQTMVDDAWKKCVFHLHTKSWMGLTNGENTFEETMETYRRLNYDVVAISDYMLINRKKSDYSPYIPVYEHGYNVKKAHQLVLGAQKVVWRDYFFTQNLHHKQHIIDVLKKHGALVAINHPGMRSSYLPNDFKYLKGYDLIEVLNGTHSSEEAWDTALSSGHPAWLIANDDSHSVNHPARLQREVTYINVPTFDILNRLSQGVAFGVHFPRKQQATMEEKIIESEAVTFPVSIQVHADTLQVVWQQTMLKIDFIGDNGKVLKTVTGSDAAFYAIRPEDTYIRVKLTSPEGLVYYLNPVIRYSGEYLPQQSLSRIDKEKTLLKRFVFAFLFGIIIVSVCFLLYNNRMYFVKKVVPLQTFGINKQLKIWKR